MYKLILFDYPEDHITVFKAIIKVTFNYKDVRAEQLSIIVKGKCEAVVLTTDDYVKVLDYHNILNFIGFKSEIYEE